jgi:adenosylcobinamide kinase / adenosylcobinamide-phosphate guanylyltransferase
MAAKLTFILGGARSGKSTYAQQLAQTAGDRVLYIATARIFDDEMARRVEAHQMMRPASWETLELPDQINTGLKPVTGRFDAILLDCVTLLLSESFLPMPDDADEAELTAAGEAALNDLFEAIRARPEPWILVSNEVGLGIVPETLMGRVFRDIQGRANQQLAALADEVYFMAAGIPFKIK